MSAGYLLCRECGYDFVSDGPHDRICEDCLIDPPEPRRRYPIVPLGTKVRVASTWFHPNTHDTVCTITALPDKSGPLYRLDSPALLSGYVYRTREEFTIVE